ELGRRAIAEPKSLLELVSLHHKVLKELFQNSVDRGSPGQLVQMSCDFLSECVSPYEMAQRGFQDAVKALRQLNETLEEEIKRIAYSVHDEAGQLLVAVHLALANLALELPPGRKEQVREIEGLLTRLKNICAGIRMSFARRSSTIWGGFPPSVFSLRESPSARICPSTLKQSFPGDCRAPSRPRFIALCKKR